MASAINSVTNFLTARRATHNGPDLIDRFLAYGCDLEVQVNVAAGNGERVPGSKSTFTSPDGCDRWFSYRIPKNADSNPEFRDYEIGYALDEHCEGIGTTGWDWKARRSRWVGFDFDSIVGHASGVGVSNERLSEVREAAKALPYVEARRSTGGQGLHLYVLFKDGIPTENHTEHAALARCLLGVMSRDAGFDFSAQIDACGGNMWLWHRKCQPDNFGLQLIKPAEREFAVEDIPTNWRDHLDVIRRRRAKVRLHGISEDDEDPFELLASAHRRVPLDDTHKLIMDELTKTGATVSWIADHHLLQTHTKAFDKILNGTEPCTHCGGTGVDPDGNQDDFEVEFGVSLGEKHTCSRCKGSGETRIGDRLGLVGIYETNSKGTDLATPNCFAFPMDRGGWKLYRFSTGITESRTWDCDGRGWTTCWFNVPPGMKQAAIRSGGKELQKGGYEFSTLAEAIEAAKILNPRADFDVEESLLDRHTIMKSSKDGRVTFEVQKKQDDGNTLGNWNNSDKKSAWTQVFNVLSEPAQHSVSDITAYDNTIRCLETSVGQPAGWAVKKRDGEWTRKTGASVKLILQKHGHTKGEAEQIMGYGEEGPWKLVMLPFQPEYPGNRLWNLGAPQLRYVPLSREECEALGDNPHPHWDLILNHTGSDLTKYLKDEQWAIQSGIRTGSDYLRAIFASIIRDPFQPTPYLFFFGPENSGKSILHEAFELLVTCGVVKADHSLTSQSDFNGELASAILCVVEEKDVSKHPGAHAKIKEAVTALNLSIRRMRTDAYMVRNMTHWIQCANHPDACPVFPGDTRVTMCYVPEPEKQIPKLILIDALTREAPAFLRTLLDMELPPLTGRLRIPIVETEHKRRIQQLSKSPLHVFIEENVYPCSGSLIPFADFYTRFIESLPPEERGAWSRIKVSKGLPMNFASGSGNANKVFIINSSWEPNTEPNGAPYTVINGKIRRVE